VENMRHRVAVLVAVVGLLGTLPAPALGAGTPLPSSGGDLASWSVPAGGPVLVDGSGEAAEEAAAAATATPETAASGFSPQGGGGTVTISGAGWGHGVGMSQYGAYGRALDGQSAADILAAYYPGTTLGPDTSGDPVWVNVESEVIKVVLRAAAIATPATPVTVTRDDTALGGGVETVELHDGDTLTVTALDLAGPPQDPRRCRFSGPGGFTSTKGSCNIDLVWDGDAAAPTMRIVIDKVWYPGTPTAGVDCTHSLGSTVLDCAYAYGRMHIRPDDHNEPYPADAGFHVVEEMSLDAYVLGIGEMPYGWPQAALQTQAIAARTFARYRTESRAAPADRPWCWCNLYDTSIDQVYLGWGFDQVGIVGPVAQNWTDAVHATDGQILTYGGAAAQTYYSSSNGGASENNEDVWGGSPIPYLRSVPDPWSLVTANPFASWDKTVDLTAFAAAVGLDEIWDVDIAATYDSGTPSDIRVVGTLGGTETTRHFTGAEFRTTFGLLSSHVTGVTGPWPVVDRWWGQDRYETAVAISTEGYPSGAGTVFVATGLNFPDALVAAPLAEVRGGPLLLVRTDFIPTVTRREIERLRPTRIVILGGEGVVSAGVADQLAAYGTVERLAGPDRYATAAAISQAAFPDQAPVVYLATGLDFPDALSAAPLAAEAGGPVLLTRPGSLPAVTRREILRLAPQRVVVLGAGTSVEQTVVDEVARYVPQVDTVTGGDALAVSAAASARGFPTGAPVAFVATVADFPDALAAGPAAAALGAPVLLTDPTALSASTGGELQRLGAGRAVILGGPAAVGTALEDEIRLALGG